MSLSTSLSCMKKSTPSLHHSTSSLFSARLLSQHHFHTNASVQYGRRQRKATVLKTPKPSTFAPSPFARYPHRGTLSAADQERKEAFSQIAMSPEQKVAIFPTYKRLVLKLESVASTPTTTLEFYVGQNMTKPEIKMWLEKVYNLQGIEKIHTSTHTRKYRRHRLNPRRKLPLPVRKKVYVELDHEIDFVSPRNDDLPFFDADVVEEVAARATKNHSSLALNWHNRRWLKDVNAPSKGSHLHRSRHKLIRDEMNKRLIVQKTLNRIEELQRRVQKIQEEEGRLGPLAAQFSTDTTDANTPVSRIDASGAALPTIKDGAFGGKSSAEQPEVILEEVEHNTKETPEKATSK